MSYQVIDTTAGLEQAMKLLKPAMKGMPGRRRFLARYNALCRQMANLVMLLDDGHAYFDDDSKIARKQKIATTAVKNAVTEVKAA